MPYQLKSKSVLHVPGGRFFKKDEVYKDVPKTHMSYFVESEKGGPQERTPYTHSELEKLSASDQKKIIEELGGDAESVKNAEQRIALILELQDGE
ncbi:hypothetical protein E2L07_05705 [Halalkalibacterium halodurans]|uniref:hypothetical protein n=1 Tax=Halalkalibacterium halodurans TaxID=86665 RepID=UPI00106739BE|nr:hypothetical protein [Halalkalibacterium halodurans]TES56181.1 hypothetical protein E2L07_05705 [Halalkalibacterium halodurans]